MKGPSGSSLKTEQTKKPKMPMETPHSPGQACTSGRDQFYTYSNMVSIKSAQNIRKPTPATMARVGETVWTGTCWVITFQKARLENRHTEKPSLFPIIRTKGLNKNIVQILVAYIPVDIKTRVNGRNFFDTPCLRSHDQGCVRKVHGHVHKFFT